MKSKASTNANIVTDSRATAPEAAITTTTNTTLKVLATIIIDGITLEISIPDDPFTTVNKAFLAGKDSVRTTHTKDNNNIPRSPSTTRPKGKVVNATLTHKRYLITPFLFPSLAASKKISN
jgi:hypothetical protein